MPRKTFKTRPAREAGALHARLGLSLEDLARYMGVDETYAVQARRGGSRAIVSFAREYTSWPEHDLDAQHTEEEYRAYEEAMGFTRDPDEAPYTMRPFIDLVRFGCAVNTYMRTLPLELPKAHATYVSEEYEEDGDPENGPHMSVTIVVKHRKVAVTA